MAFDPMTLRKISDEDKGSSIQGNFFYYITIEIFILVGSIPGCFKVSYANIFFNNGE